MPNVYKCMQYSSLNTFRCEESGQLVFYYRRNSQPRSNGNTWLQPSYHNHIAVILCV